MKKTISVFLVMLWIGLSLFVRIYGLDRSPVSVGFDEAALGYNAYSLYLTGKDEYGISYPLSLRSFNDFKPALYAYATIPFIHFFDLTQTAVRLPSAIFGTISLIFLFLIFRKITRASIGESLLICLIISFFPWRIHFSRIAFEANLSMAFFTGIVWCLLNFKNNIYYKLGVIAFSVLAIYSYHSARLAVPILLMFHLADPIGSRLKQSLVKIRKNIWVIILVGLLSFPLFLETQTNLLLTRFSQTNVFGHFYPFTPKELLTANNPWLNLIAHPLYYLGGLLSGHLFAYLSPKNLSLLIYPGVIKSAQGISGTGMLGFLGGGLFVLGTVSVLKEIVKNKNLKILIYWIAAGIIPAMLTWEWFYPLRSLNIYPALDIIAGFGFLFLIRKIRNNNLKIIKMGGLTILIISSLIISSYYLQNELNYGSWDTNGEFQPGGFKEGAAILMSLKDKYKTIYLDSPHAQNYEIFWFYMKYPPQNIQAIADKRNVPGVEGPGTLNFDNFVYRKFDWPAVKSENRFVFWTSSEVKEEEIKNTSGATIYKVPGPFDFSPAFIITKQ